MTDSEVHLFVDRSIVQRESGFGWWLLREPSGPVLGQAALKPLASPGGFIEVGYHLLPGARGYGFATEAARALIDYGFSNLGLNEIHAVVLPSNAPSRAVMQRLGMPKFGMRLHADLDHDLFRIGHDEWARK